MIPLSKAKSLTFPIILIVIIIMISLFILGLVLVNPVGGGLRITSTNLEANKPIEVIDGLTFKFNESLDNMNLNFVINPPTEVIPSFNSDLTVLTIKPVTIWNYNTEYTIKFLNPTKSLRGDELNREYQLNFKTNPVSDEPDDQMK